MLEVWLEWLVWSRITCAPCFPQCWPSECGKQTAWPSKTSYRAPAAPHQLGAMALEKMSVFSYRRSSISPEGFLSGVVLQRWCLCCLISSGSCVGTEDAQRRLNLHSFQLLKYLFLAVNIFTEHLWTVVLFFFFKHTHKLAVFSPQEDKNYMQVANHPL